MTVKVTNTSITSYEEVYVITRCSSSGLNEPIIYNF